MCQDSQGYTEKPCLEKPKQTNKKKTKKKTKTQETKIQCAFMIKLQQAIELEESYI